MFLPTKPTAPVERSPKTLVLYGKPKVGKTEITSHLDGFINLDFEDGSDFVGGIKLKIIGFAPPSNEPEELKEKRKEEGKAYFTEFGQELNQYKREHGGDSPYKGVICDTLTTLEELCEMDATWEYMRSIQGKNFNRIKGEEGLDEYGRPINVVSSDLFRPVTTLPKGAGYLWLRNSFKKWKGKFDVIAPYRIFIAHVKDITFEKSGREVSAADLDLTGKIKNITCSSVDAIGYLYRDTENPLELRVSFQNVNEDLVGSRAGHLRNQDFVLAINNEDGSIKEHFWHKIYVS